MKKLYNRIASIIKFVLIHSKNNDTGPYLISTNGQVISKGKESYHNGNFVVKGARGILKIGSYCAIGADVKVILSNHDVTNICMQYTFYRKNFNIALSENKKQIITTIENDVWIGDNVVILPGVNIGTGAVIGAGAIVTKNVAPYSIIGGNPAKLIRKRFTDEQIHNLLLSKWWEWSDEEIQCNKEFFLKNDKHDEK